MNDNEQNLYTSHDFYLSSCLIAAGLNLIRISRPPQGYFLFHFDCLETEALDLLEQHWSGQLTLPTKQLIDAIYQLKSRMRLESGR